MMQRLIVNRFSTAAKTVNKESLMKIRKATGYSFQNCKKALELFGEDVISAEKWLHKEAQKAGWSRMATNRAVSNGAVGIYVENDRSVILELNCETDFVARNEKFRRLGVQLCKDVLRNVSCISKNFNKVDCNKFTLPLERIESIKPSGDDISRNLKDLLAFYSGQLGEKLAFTRAACLKAKPNSILFGYVHPKVVALDGVYLGQFGAIVNLSKYNSDDNMKTGLDMEHFGSMLCQHIVGMKPTIVGLPYEKIPEKAENVEAKTIKIENVEGEEEEEPAEVTTLGNEKELLKQDFLLNPETKVGDILKTNDVTVYDFIRFERGETASV